MENLRVGFESVEKFKSTFKCRIKLVFLQKLHSILTPVLLGMKSHEICVSNQRSVAFEVSKQLVMFLCISSTMDEPSSSDKDKISLEAENELLLQDAEIEHPPPSARDLQTIMSSLSTSLETMASSVQRVEVSLKRLHTDNKTTSKRRKLCIMSTSDISASEDDAECLMSGDVVEHDASLNSPRARLEQRNMADNACGASNDNTCSSNSLLAQTAENFSANEDFGPRVPKKLVDIVNKRWSEKLPDSKLSMQLCAELMFQSQTYYLEMICRLN